MRSAVLFDAVGTLIYPDPPVAAVYASAGRRIGVQIGEEEIRSRFRAAFARQEMIDRQLHGLKTNPERERNRWREIVGEMFADAISLPRHRDELFHELWEHFARPKNWRLYDDVGPCWQALESHGLTIAIASNFDDRLEQIAQQIPPLDRAKRLFNSARIGHRKPAAEFFRFIERELEIPPAELLSVGDNAENDFEGALAAGWQSILLDRDRRRDSGAPGTIASLVEMR
jgi:putative hydrolase of the HAD superfamily